MATRKITEKVAPESIDVLEVYQGRIEVCVLGTTPLIMNRMSEKAKRDLLMPKGRKNAMERATTLKHSPMDEFRASPYRIGSTEAPTYLGLLTTAFKKVMMTAALDLPGTKKAQIGRLTYVNGDMTPVYGIPEMLMSTVRSADMNRTPDIRTRAIVPTWATRLSVTFIQPLMKAQAVTRLLMAGGLSVGVGDWRLEKGSGNYGLFELVEPDDPRFLEVLATGGRAAQIEAMQAPACYDAETADLLGWFDAEMNRRQTKGVA